LWVQASRLHTSRESHVVSAYDFRRRTLDGRATRFRAGRRGVGSTPSIFASTFFGAMSR
jgi:hypothetical protein